MVTVTANSNKLTGNEAKSDEVTVNIEQPNRSSFSYDNNNSHGNATNCRCTHHEPVRGVGVK